MPGPAAPRWKGRNKPRRQDRRWATSWSPQQISHRLRAGFPDAESMRISHEAIYQTLYVRGRGALIRELVACLRTGRALRVPRARTAGRGKKFVTDQVLISQRPAEAEERAFPGHDALAEAITDLPTQLRKSLTWDQGSEMAQHAQLRSDTGLEIYFADPHSPWQPGTSDVNGLLRQYRDVVPAAVAAGCPMLVSTSRRAFSSQGSCGACC